MLNELTAVREGIEKEVGTADVETLDEELEYNNFTYYGRTIRQPLAMLTPYIDAQLREEIELTSKRIERMNDPDGLAEELIEPDEPTDEYQVDEEIPIRVTQPHEVMIVWNSEADSLSKHLQLLIERIDNKEY